MTTPRAITQSVAKENFVAREVNFWKYLKARMVLDFIFTVTVWIALYGAYPSESFVADFQLMVDVGTANPAVGLLAAVLSFSFSTATVLFVDTFVVGGIAGRYAFRDWYAGMIPLWRLIGVKRLYE